MKFTSKETQAVSFGIYCISTGSNLSSFNADIRAYFPRILFKDYGLNVPIQPLNYPYFNHVTNIGQTMCLKCYGVSGNGDFLILANKVSKQK